MISAPVAATSSGRIALTLAAVPTGMKAGVSTVPCAVTSRPRRAAPSRARRVNAKPLIPRRASAGAAQDEHHDAALFQDLARLTIAGIAAIDDLGRSWRRARFLFQLFPVNAAAIAAEGVPFGVAQEGERSFLGHRTRRRPLLRKLDRRIELGYKAPLMREGVGEFEIVIIAAQLTVLGLAAVACQFAIERAGLHLRPKLSECLALCCGHRIGRTVGPCRRRREAEQRRNDEPSQGCHVT